MSTTSNTLILRAFSAVGTWPFAPGFPWLSGIGSPSRSNFWLTEKNSPNERNAGLAIEAFQPFRPPPSLVDEYGASGPAALLDALLDPVVVRLRHSLQVVLIPEQIQVAAMGADVVDHRTVGRGIATNQSDTCRLALPAVAVQDLQAQPLPARGVDWSVRPSLAFALMLRQAIPAGPH